MNITVFSFRLPIYIDDGAGQILDDDRIGGVHEYPWPLVKLICQVFTDLNFIFQSGHGCFQLGSASPTPNIEFITSFFGRFAPADVHGGTDYPAHTTLRIALEDDVS